ncbi:hypothetical protein Tco_0158957 [Tanacetum coccineum]
MSIQDMEDLKQHYLDEMKSLINDLQIQDYRNERIDIHYRSKCEIRIYELKQNFNGMSIEIRKKEKELLQQEQAAYVKLIESSVENLVPIPSESEDFSDIKSECDVPDCDDSQTTNFSTFSNPLFDDSTSSDDESSHEEVIHEMRFKTYSNPLFDLDEEIISSEFNPVHNEDPDSIPKNDCFDVETIPSRIVNREHEEYISMMERLLYDNITPWPPEAFQANSDTIIESLPTFPIPVEDSDSLREEIDIFPSPDDSIPPSIESDDDVVEDIPVDVPNILPTHPTLHMDFDFIPSHIDLGCDLDVFSTSGDSRKQDYYPVLWN